MGWEERNGRRYYYRKERRDGGTVRSVYVGSGPFAESIATFCETAEAVVSAERARLRSSLAPFDAALSALRDEADELRTWAGAYLVATGHRTHKGQWRRAHYLRPVVSALPPLTSPTRSPTSMAKKKTPAPLQPGTSSTTDIGTVFTVPDGLDEKTASALASAVAACDTAKPKPSDVSKLRDVFGRLPSSAFAPFADRFGLRSAASLLCGEGTSAVAFAEAEAERFAAELAGDDAGPLVRAAASHAATARLVLHAVTGSYSRVLRGSYSLKEGEHFERRLNAAQLRYVRALATVAALRRAEGLEAERAARLSAETDDGEQHGVDHRSLYVRGDGTPAPADVELQAT